MRVTVSLPDNITKRLFEESRRTGLKVSQIVKTSLEEHMEMPEEVKVTPVALWKLRGRRYARGPSITARRKKVGTYYVVDLDKLQV